MSDDYDAAIFRTTPRLGIRANVNDHWTFVNYVPLPRPGWLRCPVCGDGPPQARWWQWHQRPAGHTIPWRCDVSWKCRACSAIWAHGIALSRHSWDRRPFPGREATRIKWRDVAGVLGVGGEA